jgi:TsgA-like MFS transporter
MEKSPQFKMISLSLVAFLTYMIMSGLLTQIGVIIGPLSTHLKLPVTDTAALFSYLTGGTFAGTFISMLVYQRFSIAFIVRVAYVTLVSVLIAMVVFQVNSASTFAAMLFVLGICCGVGLSGGAVIISKIYLNDQNRASAFLATDCSFSLAGYVFPTLAAALGAAGVLWSIGYSSVAVLAVVVIISTIFIHFPETIPQHDTKTEKGPSIWTIRVFLISIALCIYLLSQTSFLTWAPQYLQTRFGLPPEEAAAAVGNYWGPSIFGLLSATYLITKVPTRLFLMSVSILAVLLAAVLYFTTAPQIFLKVTLALGFLTSCIFKIGISVGSQQIPRAPPILVTFLLCSATMGSTLAPVVSAKVVALYGVHSAILLTLSGFSCVTILFALCLMIEKRQKQVSSASDCAVA